MSSDLLTNDELRARAERMKAPPRLQFAKTTELLALASDGDADGGRPPIVTDAMSANPRHALPPRPEGSGSFDASQGVVFGELRAIPDALLPVPPWEDDLLPESLRPWASDVSERMQAAPEFNAVGVLATLGSVIGRQVVVLPKRFDNWAVVPHPWAAVIGAPALMKSPALRESLAFLRRLETGARKEFEQKIAEHLAMSEVAKARREAIKERIKKAAKDGNEDELKSLQAELAKLPGDPGEPPERRFMVNDATVEKLGEVLAQNPFGILTFRDELAGWLRQLDRDGREGERTFYLECWDGLGSFTFDRISRGTVRIDPACLTVLGGIQPGPLGEYLRAAVRGGAGDDGLVQRFQLAVYPDVPPHWRNVDRPPDEAAVKTVDELFRACSSGAIGGTGRGRTSSASANSRRCPR